MESHFFLFTAALNGIAFKLYAYKTVLAELRDSKLKTEEMYLKPAVKEETPRSCKGLSKTARPQKPYIMGTDRCDSLSRDWPLKAFFSGRSRGMHWEHFNNAWLGSNLNPLLQSGALSLTSVRMAGSRAQLMQLSFGPCAVFGMGVGEGSRGNPCVPPSSAGRATARMNSLCSLPLPFWRQCWGLEWGGVGLDPGEQLQRHGHSKL